MSNPTAIYVEREGCERIPERPALIPQGKVALYDPRNIIKLDASSLSWLSEQGSRQGAEGHWARQAEKLVSRYVRGIILLGCGQRPRSDAEASADARTLAGM